MMNTKGWLYLPVEVKVRELDAKLLLAYYAAIKGYTIVIGEHKMVELAAEHYPPGVFFSKGYPKHIGKQVITNARENRHKIVELDEEGLIIQDKKTYLQDRASIEVQTKLEHIYCWGRFQEQIVTGSSPAVANKCHVTGSPRMDLLKPKYRQLYVEDVKRISDRFAPFILVNTRFSQYNAVSGIKETHPQSMYTKSLYEHFVQMIKDVSKKFPEVNIVVRPHPGENFAVYKQTFSSYPNVYVIHEGNIIKWLMAAGVVIHNGCTSSIEAFLLEKQIISYMPITSLEYDVQLPNQLGEKATSSREVEELIIEMLHNLDKPLSMNSPEHLKKVLDPYCSNLSEQFSFEKILRFIDTIQFLNPARYPSTFKPLYLKEKKYVKYFFPSLSNIEIQTFFANLNNLEGERHMLSIKNLGRNVFQINAG